MKTPRLFLGSLLLVVLVANLRAQTPPPPAAVKPIEPARVAYIKTDAFLDEGNGIKILVKVLKDLETQFQPQQSELMLINSKFNALAQEIQQLRANPPESTDQKVLAAKIAEAQQLQRTSKTKGDAAQAAYNKRSLEVKGPIEAQIVKEISVFRQERGIDLILDSSRLGGALLSGKPEMDLTNDFIAWFNAKHPLAAAG
jgi:Skp family chaperone for outer membrane proteins